MCVSVDGPDKCSVLAIGLPHEVPASAFRMLFLLWMLVATYPRCLWKAMEASRWTTSIFGLRASVRSDSATMIFGCPLLA